ncbi:PilW family protein [Pseudoalteromonas fenneropenaei]|uniref:PilW family protein n=1 Tax=Pseudoalteromonas fenneropenaei TaxID=1737459 RepID=A0ABV7CLW9_9GAMM
MLHQQVHKGYTLIELMVALAAGAFLLSGVAMSYSAIKSTIVVSKELELAQEVVRYSNQVLTRSIKQATSTPLVSNAGAVLTITQDANTISCTGSVITTAYTEVYQQEGEFLVCDVGNGKVQLLKGLAALTFAQNAELTSITIQAKNMPAPMAAGVRIDIAATQSVVRRAFP